MSSGWKKLLTFVLGALFVVAFVGLVVGLVIRRDLLDPSLYTTALSENDVYERVYVDIFGDPAMQDALADSLNIESNLIAGEAYAELIATFNLILPPPRLQNAAELFLLRLTQYLSGDIPELDPDLPLDDAIDAEVLAERISSALVAGAIQVSSHVLPLVGEMAAPLVEDELLNYLDNVSQGRIGPIPEGLVTASVQGLTDEEQDSLVLEMLGPVVQDAGSRVKLQMKAALVEDDLTSAIAIAMRERLGERITEAAVELETTLAESDALNAAEQIAVTLDMTGESVIAMLNAIRAYADMAKNLLLPISILLAVLMGLIVWLNNDTLSSMLRASGWTLTAAGGLVLLAWLAAGFWLRNTLQTTLGAETGMPVGVEGIVDDVVASLSRNIWDSVWATALFWTAIGLLLLVFGYSRPLLDGLDKLLAPVSAHIGWVITGLLVLLVLVPLLLWTFSPTQRTARLACNGHVELCDRPANEVAYATTHNSMSISQYGWLWPSHDGTIADQLDAGVRGLLIDTHYADTLEKIEEALVALPPAAQQVARNAIESADFEAKGEDSFLCHMACGLGASALTDSLADIRSFLEENPREVLFVVFQDEITPADTELAVQAAGLEPYIYTHEQAVSEQGTAWPTLGEMIDADQRLVIMSENENPPPAWYQNVWDNTMETPYTFINYDDFSCEPNRGSDDAPFFMLNHWIQRGSPNRVDASVVNDYDFLLARAQQCEEERGKMPNFIAVNFYQNGNVFDVVDTLNGVGNVE